MIQTRNILFIVLVTCASGMFAQESFQEKFAKLRSNPKDFFMYKEGAEYWRQVKANGWDRSAQWRDFKTFAKTPTGKTIIVYKLVSLGVKGYLGYKAYQLAQPAEKKADDIAGKKSDDIAEYWDRQQWDQAARESGAQVS